MVSACLLAYAVLLNAPDAPAADAPETEPVQAEAAPGEDPSPHPPPTTQRPDPHSQPEDDSTRPPSPGPQAQPAPGPDEPVPLEEDESDFATSSTQDEGTVRAVTVTSIGDSMEDSAEAVQVEDTRDAQGRTADLGDVLKRSRGVTVRRAGGLGGRSNIGVAGLDGPRVPIFVDGIPIEFSPYSLDPSNVPVGFVDRVEIYQGVVPTRFGADALGGAVNLARDFDGYGPSSSLSYEGGSFDTHRVLGRSSVLLEGPNIYAAIQGFYDRSQNDYPIDVEVARDDGSTVPTTVRRRNAEYAAGGGAVTVGVVDKPWAERLLLTGFASGYQKQLPHNVVMTLPYGSPVYGEVRPGANLDYRAQLPHDLELTVLGAYAQRRIAGEDTDRCVYDWFGQCLLERAVPGEIEPGGTDQRIVQDGGYANVTTAWAPGRHRLQLALSPSGFTRTGRDALTPAGERDPLSLQRDLFKLVSALEYAVDLFDDALQSVTFAKHYTQAVRAERFAFGVSTLPPENRTETQWGVGQALRWKPTSWLRVKTSYEWATRLPSVDELFGNGILVVENLELRPERSHNVNLAASLSHVFERAGEFWLDAHGGARWIEDAIAPIPEDNRISSQNVNDARSYTVDGGGGWTSPDAWVTLEGNVTFIDLRNTSTDGPFGPFAGDRMPARPWLTSNGHAQLLIAEVASKTDALSLDWSTHYVHSFFRSWESAGTAAFKQVVPAQLLHDIGAAYRIRRRRTEFIAAVAVHNLLDARAFDFIGSQLPTRAVRGKLTIVF
ncbi:MAG: TonB-dependent receptor [Myxococcota bacterium]